MGTAPVLNQIHCSHAAHVVRVAHKLSAWGLQADFAAVTSHPAAIGLASFRLSWSAFVALTVRLIVIDAVVVLTQHRQIRWLGMPTVFMRVDVVDLASIGRYGAVRPRTHQVFRHG